MQIPISLLVFGFISCAMYKLFYFDECDAPFYKPIKGVWPSVDFFLAFLKVRFGARMVYRSGINEANFIKIPFNGVHDSEATGYSLSAIKSRKALVSLAAKREGPGSRP